jgi:uncharacterized membrane protein (DUF106 family)
LFAWLFPSLNFHKFIVEVPASLVVTVSAFVVTLFVVILLQIFVDLEDGQEIGARELVASVTHG